MKADPIIVSRRYNLPGCVLVATVITTPEPATAYERATMTVTFRAISAIDFVIKRCEATCAPEILGDVE